MSRVGIITQARTGSTRLPAKVLLTAAGVTFLEHHLARLSSSGLDVYVATTTKAADDRIAELSGVHGIPVCRGSEGDVLSRFDECATAHGLDVVVRVTSDCPLVDGAVIADAVRRFLDAGDPWLYLSNTLERTFPRGLDFEVFSAQALREASIQATTPTQREHVTPFLRNHPTGAMRLQNYVSPHKRRPQYRVTLDEPADLELLRRLIEEYRANVLTHRQIVDLLDAHPELVAITADVAQRSE